MIRKAFAQTNLSDFYTPGKALGGRDATIGTLLSPLIQNAIYIIALASFAAIVFAGFNYVTSSGDKAKVQQATTMLNYALLGLTLAVAAFVITQIIGQIGGFTFFKTNP